MDNMKILTSEAIETYLKVRRIYKRVRKAGLKFAPNMVNING